MSDLSDTGPTRLQVTEAQIQAAMAFYEAQGGPRDGVSIGKEVSALADLLGAMWFYRETEALVGVTSRVAALLAGAGVLALPADCEPGTALPAPATSSTS